MSRREEIILNALPHPQDRAMVSHWIQAEGYQELQAVDADSFAAALRRGPCLILAGPSGLKPDWALPDGGLEIRPPVLTCGASGPAHPPALADDNLPMPPGGELWSRLVRAWTRSGQALAHAQTPWRELCDALDVAAALVGPRCELLAANRALHAWAAHAGLPLGPGSRLDAWFGDSYHALAALLARARWSGRPEAASLALAGSSVRVRVATADPASGRMVLAWESHLDPDATASRDDAERIEALERDARLHDALTPHPATAGPLRSSNPNAFCTALERYELALERSIERLGYRDTDPDEVPRLIRSLADLLGQARAGPRDVVELHSLALRRKTAGALSARSRAYLNEGRFLVVELMGWLAEYYRDRTTAEPRVRTGPARGHGHPAGQGD